MKPLIVQEVSYEKIIEDDSTRIKLNIPPVSDEEFPTVSIVIPTYERHNFFPLIKRNWEKIDYPKEKLELIVLDNSKISSQYFLSDHKVKYLHDPIKKTIGALRNTLAKLATKEYIVHMDDDDWYPAESVAARIRILLEFQKQTGTLGCFGCTKVLCMDLITAQMFEAYDRPTIDVVDSSDSVATISESTMAYSKKYWEQQKFDNESVMAECLPFISNRESTVITGPSVFVVTQFTHDSNTVTRRVTRTSVGTGQGLRFQSSLDVFDNEIYGNLRADVIRNIPEYKEAIKFCQYNEKISKSKFKANYNNLSETLKKNPMVIELFRERMTTCTIKQNKDPIKISYYCGPGQHLSFSNKWCPESKQIGGSEEAVINLSQELTNRGYEVTVYCVLENEPRSYNRVRYEHYYSWIPQNYSDITIIWRDPSNLLERINSDKIFLDLHDTIDPSWIISKSKKVTVMTKSNFHLSLFNKTKLKQFKNCVIPNGIYPLKFDKTKKQKNTIICTSSPDRCLGFLLNALPLIRKEVPDAEIYWAYGFSSGISEGGLETDNRPEVKKWLSDTKKQIKDTPGFHNLGRLSQKEVNELYEKADLFVYCTHFPEIDCISLTKAMSAGCIPICTPSGSLTEKLGLCESESNNLKNDLTKLTSTEIDYSLRSGPDFDFYVNKIIKTLNSKNIEEIENSRETYVILSELYSWKLITNHWERQFKQ